MATRVRNASNKRDEWGGGYDISTTSVYGPSGGKMRKTDIEALKCPKCSKLLREPVQLISCGCRYCSGCIDRLIQDCTDPSSLRCPVDSNAFSKKQIRKDKGCVRDINGLQVDCPTQPTPCRWKGLLVEAEDHMRLSCPNAEVVCNRGCGETFIRSKQNEHELTCNKRQVQCTHCNKLVTKDELEDHLKNVCQESPIECDFCREKLAKRSEFQKHLEDVCTEYEMYCPMQKLTGCDFKSKRFPMIQHSQQHTIFMLEKVTTLCDHVQKITSENKRLSLQVREKDDLISKLNERLTIVERYIEIPDAVETDGRVHTSKSSKVRTKGPSSTRFFPRYGERVATDGGPNTETRQIGSLVESAESNKVQLLQLSENMQTLQQSFTQQSIAVDELRLRQDILDVRTTNGVFIWKIPDIRRRYREAIDRLTVSIYSPPYFTSPQGYRICTRVYLNGDGIGKGTHISVFFVLMRSEHDSLLQWPFKQSVRFTMINQVNSNASITEAFAPDLQSPSFQQPENEMNIASGFPKFAKQSVLQDESFTKGNTIFIKAQVDLTGLTAC